MKWNSHIIIGTAYGLAVNKYDPIIISVLGVGAVAPDMIDRLISMGNETLWHSIHRKISHFWLIYLSLIFVCVNSGWYYPYYFFIGCLLHVYADSLTISGVPFLNPLRAGSGLRKASTGKLTEYIYAGVMVIVILIAGFLNDYIPLWIMMTVAFVSITVAYQKQQPHDDKKKEEHIELSTLAKLWTGMQKTVPAVVDAEQIDVHSQATSEDINSPTFVKPEFVDFYMNHVSDLPGKEIIAEVMKILDTKGDCPSVVNRSTDINPYSEPLIFEALAKVPLWQHSLHVATEILKTVSNPGAYASQLLLAAFGHDLGKSPALERTMYNMGDHMRISVLLMEGIRGFNDLPYKNDVEAAILSHHSMGGGSLADHLREADMNARRAELSEIIHTQVAVVDTVKAETAIEKPAETDLSWLNIDEFLDLLRNRINVLSGKRFDAFNLSDIVYFQTDLFWKILKKLARDSGHDEILFADSDQEMRRNYLFTITEMLREKRFIADGLIKSGYFSAPFVVQFKDGTKFKKAYYTPMHAEAFGTVSDLETIKCGIIKDILSVNPKYMEDDE